MPRTRSAPHAPREVVPPNLTRSVRSTTVLGRHRAGLAGRLFAENVVNDHANQLVQRRSGHLGPQCRFQPTTGENLLHFGRDAPCRLCPDVPPDFGKAHRGGLAGNAPPQRASALASDLARRLGCQMAAAPWQEPQEQIYWEDCLHDECTAGLDRAVAASIFNRNTPRS